jgi:hypothetical protein
VNAKNLNVASSVIYGRLAKKDKTRSQGCFSNQLGARVGKWGARKTDESPQLFNCHRNRSRRARLIN